MKPSDRNKIKMSKDDVNSRRKKFLKKVAVTTALVGVTGIAVQNLAEIKGASAMMRPPVKPPISKPAGTFIGSGGNFRPVYKPVTSGIGGFKPTSVKPPAVKPPVIKPPTVKPPVAPKPGTSVVKPPVAPKPGVGTTSGKPSSISSVSKPGTSNNANNGTSVIKPGNTSSLINKYEGMNKGNGKLPIDTAPPKPGAKPPAKPPIVTQSTGSGVGKPSGVTGSQTGSGGLKPTGTSGKPSGTTSTGTQSGKPSGTTSAGSQTGSGGLKPTGTSGKPSGTTSTGAQPGKPGITSTGTQTGAGGLKPTGTSSKPGGTTSTGTQTGKPGSGKLGAAATVGTQTSVKGSRSSSLKKDSTVNTSRVSSNTTNNTVHSSGGGKFSKVMAAFGVLTTGAFLATSIVGILQGQQSLEAQKQLQQEAIQAQQDLMNNQQRQEYEKLAAQLGGTYDPETGVIILPSGSKLNVMTGIVTHPDGSWTDANGNLHMPDGSGTIKPNGDVQINGVGTIDKEGNLVLNDGSGHYDPQGNFHASGQLNSVIGIAGGAGYGGMYTDTRYGGTDVINQSGNYGKKAYDGITHEEAHSKASAHLSVERGIFTAKEFDSIVNLIISAKLNKPMAERMTKDGQFTSEQLQVILDLLDIYEKNGKI